MDPDALARPEGLADSQTHHDFNKGKRWSCCTRGAVGYQTLINNVLRRFIEDQEHIRQR